MDQVWDQVRNQVRNQVWSQVENQVENQVSDQVWSQVMDQVRDQVRNQVRNQVWSQVMGQVRDQVMDQVRDQVGDKKLEFIEQGFGLQWSGWIAFYEFFRTIFEIKSQDYKRYSDFNKKGTWSIQYFKHFVFVCKLPIKVLRDENNRLHSLVDGAVQWRDGQKDYFIHGVSFDFELWNKIVTKNITASEVLQLKNQEQKSIAISEIGYSEIIKAVGGKLIDISRKKIFIYGSWRETENELYQIDNLYPNVTVMTVKCICPSTGRAFFLDVPPDTKNANEAIAWTFGLQQKEYEEIAIET